MDTENEEKFIEIEAFKAWAKEEKFNPDDVATATTLMMDYFNDEIIPDIEVGQRIWTFFVVMPIRLWRIEEYIVTEIKQSNKRYVLVAEDMDGRSRDIPYRREYIGREIFLTREEAEKALNDGKYLEVYRI